MDPELFRHIVPGLIFWLPVFVLLAMGFETPKDEGLTWATVLFAATPPVGWLIYQNFRALWIGWPGHGYEKSPFIRVLRQNMRFRWEPSTHRVLVDLRRMSDRLGIRQFEYEQFLRCFHWRSFARIRNSFTRHQQPQLGDGGVDSIGTLSLEPLADLMLFADPSFDYARTISTVRYAYMTAAFALANGLIFAGSLWLVLGTTRRGGAASFTEAFREAVHHGLQSGFSGNERAGINILAVWATMSLVLAVYRFRLASAEYFGRTTLITVMKTELGVVKNKDVEPELVPALQQAILHLGGDGIAAVDLDGTLITGDIGEAVFARLLLDGAFGPQPAFNYSAYEKLKLRDREQAYREVVVVMKGCTEHRVRKATESVLSCSSEWLEVEGFRVPVPRPKAELRQLLQVLWARRYRCLVVTASNQWSAEVVAWKYFGIAPNNVFGVRTLVTSGLHGKRLTDRIAEPATIGAGKGTLLRSVLGDAALDLAAGDSSADGAMMSLVRQRGVVVWVGDASDGERVARAHLQEGVHFVHLG